MLGAAPGMRSPLPRGTGPGRRSQAGGPVIQETGLMQEECTIHDAVRAAGDKAQGAGLGGKWRRGRWGGDRGGFDIPL